MFQLQLITADTTKLVLNQETELGGLSLINAAQNCLRRFIPNGIQTAHEILGALPTYNINIPYDVAKSSNKFTSSNTLILTVDEDILSHYIFYTAKINYLAGKQLLYPYYNDKLTLISQIDEVEFITDWVASNYGNPFSRLGT